MALTDPVPSAAFDVLQRNAQDVDKFVNTSSTFLNRVGDTIKSVQLLESEAQTVIDSLGFVTLDPLTFETGATITSKKQLLEWAVADGGNGFHYYWAGALPKTVAAASTPASSGGTGAGAWLIQDDLEQRLNDGSASIGGELASTVAYIAKRTVLPSGGDDTTAITDKLSTYDEIWLVAGTYNISELFISDGKTVHTAGKSTVLQQIAGLVGDIRIININAGKVAFALEGITVKGNISTDTGEQRHGIIIRNNSAAKTDINIGNVWGENLRGDAVYIGDTYVMPDGSAAIKHVKVGNVYAKNCFRNGVSITNNVDQITIGDIFEDFDLGCGYCAIDIEPDNAGKPCKNITVGNVTGRRVGVVSQFAATRVNADFGHLDLDETRGAPSPSISVTTGSDFYGRGVVLRNCDATFKSIKMRNFRRNPVLALKTGGDLASTCHVISLLDIDECNTEMSAFKDLVNASGLSFFNVGELKVTALDSANEFAIVGNSAMAETSVKIGKVDSNNCRFARFCGLNIGSGSMDLADDINMFQNLSLPSTIKSTTINSGRIAAFNTAHMAFESCEINWDGSSKFAGGNAGYHVSEIGCITNGTWTGIRIDDVAVTVP